MSRGGYGNSGIPLNQRVRVDGTAAERPAPVVEPSPARHCFVSLPVDGSRPTPGLLVEWRKGELGRWEGRVVYLASLRPGSWALVEEWVAAELLTTP